METNIIEIPDILESNYFKLTILCWVIHINTIFNYYLWKILTNETRLKEKYIHSIKKQPQLDLFHYISENQSSPLSEKDKTFNKIVDFSLTLSFVVYFWIH